MSFRRQALFLLILALYRQPLPGQQQTEEYRRQSIEEILRIQDLRTPHNDRLVSFLSDGDPVVRERATLACGSLQDTTLLPLLVRNLTEATLQVQRAAAFAIGQTGTQLGVGGRESLEYDLIWKRLDFTGAAEQLIEEIGKFGTAAGLRDLMVRVGNVPPFRFRHGMTMSLARYAIRGIVSDDGVGYLLRFIGPPEETLWETVYALQRIGDHPLIEADLEQVVLLERHRDPLVRMQLATLLGKVRKQRIAFEVLCRLAEYDSDWRVRVNAIRSLSLFPLRGQEGALRIFAKAMYDANEQVALTALGVVGSTGLSELDSTEAVVDLFSRLHSIAENRDHDLSWQEQGAAAVSYARLAGASALSSVMPTTWPEPRLEAQLIEAVGATGVAEAGSIILRWVSSDDPIIACAALEALRALAGERRDDTLLRRQVYESGMSALLSSDISIVTTAAALLGDSLFLTNSSVPPLIQRLGEMRLPDDLEAMQEVVATLGSLGDRRALPVLIVLLNGTDRSIALAASAALTRITGLDYSGSMRSWFQPVLTDFDFHFLEALPPHIPVRLETSKGNIFLELDRDAAPFTIMSMLKLASQRGFYRGLQFHRVVPNFVVQGGDPRGDGWGGPGYSLRSEFSPFTYGTGTVGIASAGKDTEGSQFFITHSPQPHLDGRYTIVGHVTGGMDVVDKLQVGDRLYELSLLGQAGERRPH